MSRKTFLCLAAAAVLAACRTPVAVRQGVTLPRTLQESFDQGKLNPEILAEEAWFDGGRVYLRYRVGGQSFHSGTDGAEAGGPGAATEGEDKRREWKKPSALPVVPLAYHSPQPWKDLPPGLDPVPILSPEDWDRFLDRIIETVAPRKAGQGIMVDYLNKAEYVLYRDEEGKAHFAFIQEKPPQVRVLRHLEFGALAEKAFPLMEEFLEERGISPPRVLFNTADAGIYSIPFVYADPGRKTALFLQLVPGPDTSFFFPDTTVVAAAHILGSHLKIVFQPFTSVQRLFFLLTDTVAEALPSFGDGASPGELPPLSEGPDMDLTAWERDLDGLVGHPSVPGTVRYLIDGEEFFARFLEEVMGAQSQVDIRTYIFHNDDYAVKVADILKERSKTVAVCVLADGLGTIVSAQTPPAQPRSRDAPIPGSIAAYLESGSRVKVRLADNPWFTADHVKTMTIDRKTAFLGGMNIGREYRYEWHDMMVETRGPVVDILAEEFDRAWAQAGFWGDLGVLWHHLFSRKNPPAALTGGEIPLRVLVTRAGVSEIYLAQMEAARRARRRIFVENPYFSDDRFLDELVRARRRGVDVRVILTVEGDFGVMNRSNVRASNALVSNGVRVFLFPGMSHVKAALYDGWACLGSANFDSASFQKNEEINLGISDPAAVKELEDRLFTPDFAACPELKQPYPEKWFDFLVEMLADHI